jgi:hypothetical protein
MLGCIDPGKWVSQQKDGIQGVWWFLSSSCDKGGYTSAVEECGSKWSSSGGKGNPKSRGTYSGFLSESGAAFGEKEEAQVCGQASPR